MKSRYYLLCAASGCVWAVIAWVLGQQMQRIVWGGILVSPLVGLAPTAADAGLQSDHPILRGAPK